MKIRNGFVSNSSSSSFMIALKEEDFNEIYKGLSPLEKELVDHLGTEEKKAFGINLRVLSGMEGNYSSFEDFSSDLELTEEEESDLDDQGPECIFDKVLDKFRAKDHFEHGESF